MKLSKIIVMKKKIFFLVVLSCMIVMVGSAQTPFGGGNIVVVRIGDGSAALTTAAHPVFLDEYTSMGAFVRSIPMPTADAGANNIYTLPALQDVGATPLSYGALTLSPDRKHLACSGYDAPVGSASGDILLGSLFDRTIAIVDHNGNVNTSTHLSSAPPPVGHDISNTYSAVTSNGTDIWVTFSSTGIWYTTIGSTTATSIVSGGGAAYRTLGISQGQLYTTRQISGQIRRVGTGLPTSASSATPLSGISVLGPNSFFFADLNPAIAGDDVVYVAGEFGGLAKYSFNGSGWTPNGVIGGDADDYISLTGVVSGGSVTLFATKLSGTISNPSGGGQLVKLTDATGYAGTFAGTPDVLVNASNQTIFRGVSMTPYVPPVSVAAKAFLQGAYSTTLSRHRDVTPEWAAALNANALNQPFTGLPFNYAGTESVVSGFFTSTPSTTDIVDWVLLELHDAVTPSIIIASKAAFIREDGRIVGIDGTSDPSFTNISEGNYHLVIRHRNHTAIRTSSVLLVNTTPILYDFTTGQAQAFQNGSITTNAAMAHLGGSVFGLWGGDANSDNVIKFKGTDNDSDALLTALNSNQAAILRNVYSKADLNLDGTVRYTGLNNDAGILVKALNADQEAVRTSHQ
jgi:hypothetical protein